MTTKRIPPPGERKDEISELITTLHETEQRLEELTGGEVDTVSDERGRTYLLRRAQEHLRDSQAAKQASILNALPASIAMLDAQGFIVSVNETWRQFASANCLQVPAFRVGLNYLDICARAWGDDSAEAHRIAAGIRAVFLGAKTFSVEYPCHSPAEQRWFLMAVTPLTGAQASGAVVMHLNITERKQAEMELRAIHTQLEQRVAERTMQLEDARLVAEKANLAKSDFLSTMSHELRTPLNAILGLSEALLEQSSSSLTPRQIKSITTISTSGKHLLTVINDILDLSKVESGKLELNPEAVNMPEFCESCLLFVRTQAMQKDIAITFDYDHQTARFMADPKRLKQILVNLLTNAVKFTPAGGRIGLSVTSPAGENAVQFTVWDTGIGIAPENERKLFRAFSQIDSGLTRAQEGTGLGLVLVARLVELHGGSVRIESKLGQGSRFIVSLPQSAVLASPREILRKSETDRRSRRRALVIEDDLISSAILVRYLTELNLDSVVHVRGEESVETVLREKPDVILLDIQLPGESGWVVLVRLKDHPGTKNIPVVVISVVDEPGRSRALGAVAHFTKPVTRAQLADLLQRDPVSHLPAGRPSAAPLAPLGPVILLAEDNEANVQTIGGYLEDKGYLMHYAINGLLAVKLARELRPALILMDIQMPVMDGLTAIREIRADEALKVIPIVALTALAMPGDRERCLAAGATDYMSKPVSLKALSELVKRLVPSIRSSDGGVARASSPASSGGVPPQVASSGETPLELAAGTAALQRQNENRLPVSGAGTQPSIPT
jgi:signal transduction histidine kinase/CheY-like chemotaxis protein